MPQLTLKLQPQNTNKDTEVGGYKTRYINFLQVNNETKLTLLFDNVIYYIQVSFNKYCKRGEELCTKLHFISEKQMWNVFYWPEWAVHRIVPLSEIISLRNR